MAGCSSASSRNPFPRGQPQPFDQWMRPYPDEARGSDFDLADAFHAGPQGYGVVLETGFDAEEILALLRDRDRGDLGKRQRQRAPGETGERQPAPLADADIPDITLIDLQNHSIA